MPLYTLYLVEYPVAIKYDLKYLVEYLPTYTPYRIASTILSGPAYRILDQMCGNFLCKMILYILSMVYSIPSETAYRVHYRIPHVYDTPCTAYIYPV